jgi:DnaJ-class molecular chaperone with C-terminal Zn finger domain
MIFRVDLVEALAGFDKAFTHFDGHEVRLKRDGITTPGLVETIAKEGMPVHNQHKKFGNLVVTYQVDFPKKLTEKQKGEVKKLFAGTF